MVCEDDTMEDTCIEFKRYLAPLNMFSLCRLHGFPKALFAIDHSYENLYLNNVGSEMTMLKREFKAIKP